MLTPELENLKARTKEVVVRMDRARTKEEGVIEKVLRTWKENSGGKKNPWAPPTPMLVA